MSQMEDRTVVAGSSPTLNVDVAGTGAVYSWWRNNESLTPSAPLSDPSYTIENIQTNQSGSYIVTAWGTNANSQLTNYFTTQAQITVVPAPGWLANVQFVPPDSTLPEHRGWAATGRCYYDYWNRVYAQTPVSGQNTAYTQLLSSDGAATPVGIYVLGDLNNVIGFWDRAMANFDDMYDHYMSRGYQSITITLTGMPPGSYDLYLYGHGQNENENGSYSAKVGNNAWSDSKSTTNSDGTS